MPHHPPIVLASSSPRRIELLKQARLEIQVRSPDVNEDMIRGESPRQMVLRLSKLKAAAVAESWPSPALVIAADTTVVAPGGRKVLGKPVDVVDAEKMLLALSGKTHTVFTGFTIYQVGVGEKKVLSRVVASKVTMRSLSLEVIRRYIQTGEPMDKAGAYGAQGIGMCLIEKISGSYTNVVGLPMSQLLADLEKKFGLALLL